MIIKRIKQIKNLKKSKEFEKTAKGKSKTNFTRKRKLSIPLIASLLVNNKGKTLKMELRRFFEETKTKKI